MSFEFFVLTVGGWAVETVPGSVLGSCPVRSKYRKSYRQHLTVMVYVLDKHSQVLVKPCSWW